MSKNLKFRLAFRSILIVVSLLFSCDASPQTIITGAERMDDYIGMTTGRKIAITGNHSSLVNGVHLVDTLLSVGVDVVKIFSPEHGFRGEAGAGEIVTGSVDTRTGIPIISLYGTRKKPLPEDMQGIDLMIFDIQDVGVRFYTYISTLHYLMEACAEEGVPLLVLDRPNPNGNYMDGPMLEKEHSSFIGMHPVPLVHGMTIGEYARMINGEGWLKDNVRCELNVISCLSYSRNTDYILPVPPSPNLRTTQAIRLYPSTGLFEGTIISEGRGTDSPFEVYGHPDLPYGDYQFTPVSVQAAKNPKLKGLVCRGEHLGSWMPPSGKWERIELQWLIKAYRGFPEKEKFFTDFFFKLCGTRQVYEDIRAGLGEEEIRAKWVKGIEEFEVMREKYLLY